MRNFVIKTYFDLFNIVLESFPIFYIVCIKCIEAEVLNSSNLGCLERKKKGWKCRKDPKRLLPIFGFGSRQRFSLSRQIFLALFHYMVLCVTIWFPSCTWLLVRDSGFPNRDIVVFFWFSIATGVLPMSRQCFILFATEGPVS